MTMPPTNHDTIVLQRTYDATAARVFEAFASPQARMRWGAPSPSADIVYDKADFRVGGVDLSRCGPPGHLVYSVETRYLDIVPQQRIISTEVVSEGTNRLCFALITVEFFPAGRDTRLILTDQVAAFGGRSLIEGHRAGHAAALENLTAELRRLPADA